MTSNTLRIGIAGCGHAAQIHLERLLALDGVHIVGCADPDRDAANTLASQASVHFDTPVGSFSDYRQMLDRLTPDALAIFSPHLAHYRPAMDGLQAGCHLFIEKPLSTNLQEAVDIVGLARGRERVVGVGHQYRLSPSLGEARRLLGERALGQLSLVTATFASPWPAGLLVTEGGLLGDGGGHLLDALLWTTGQAAAEAAAFQTRLDSGADLVTAAMIRLADGTPATLAVTGLASGGLFELNYFGENGHLRATDRHLELETPGGQRTCLPIPEPTESIDGNFVAAVLAGRPICCPAEEALATVRLLEALTRSAATGEIVRRL